MRNAQPVRSNARRSWATICSRVWLSQAPCGAMSAGGGIVFVGDLLEHLERGGLRGGGSDLSAAEILELGEEGRVDRDLLRARVLEHDHRPAGHLARLVSRLVPERRARGGQNGDGELAPVRHRVLAFGG